MHQFNVLLTGYTPVPSGYGPAQQGFGQQPVYPQVGQPGLIEYQTFFKQLSIFSGYIPPENSGLLGDAMNMVIVSVVDTIIILVTTGISHHLCHSKNITSSLSQQEHHIIFVTAGTSHHLCFSRNITLA